MDMELREFVKQALVNIVGAVADAAGEVKKQRGGAIISPRLERIGDNREAFNVESEDGGGLAFPMRFDLSVTVTTSETQQNQMGGKLKLAVLSAGAGQQETDVSARTAAQRIQFTVPVRFPQTDAAPPPSVDQGSQGSWSG